MSRIPWSVASLGAQVIPVLLVNGMPMILYPDGVTVSGFSITSPDAAWWPGNTFDNWTDYAKPWLMLSGDGIRVSERAIPGATTLLEVSEVTFHISDVDLAATQMFSSQDLAIATFITSEVSASATTIPVVDTTAFTSSGVIYLDQEAIFYSGKTSTTFTGCTRGALGSKATRHIYSVAQGAGMGNPQVTNIPVDYVGRPATLWLARVEAGVITSVELEHYGTLGTGPALADDDSWVLTVDHAIKRMGQTIHANTISVGGYAHPGNLGARTTAISPPDDDLTPFFLRIGDSPTTSPTLVLLTGDATAPDLGGWHPTRESYVAALNGITLASGTFTAVLTDGGALNVSFRSAPPTARFYTARVPCTEEGFASNIGSTAANDFIFNFGAMSQAWVPIMSSSYVYVSASDYASVPPAPSSSLASYVLIFGDDNDRSSRRVARIISQGTSGAANYLLCSALTTGATARGSAAGTSGTTAPTGTTIWRGGYYADGFVITEPTTARLGLSVSSSSWVTALQTVVESLATEYACVADAIDFTRMREIADAYPSALTPRREYVVDLNTTVLSMLQNEAALNGFALTMYRGRVSIARVAEFATTETTSASITTTDLCADGPVPGYELGADGIVNTYTITSPDDGVTVNYTDQTSHARFGGQGTITATMPRTILGIPRDGSRLYQQVVTQAIQVLGPLRYPYRHVTIQVPLSKYDLQVGDLASVTLWRIPNGSGGRGIVGAVAQVIAREVVLYGEQHDGHVTYTVRLNPTNISGYAPTLLVAAGGISGGVVTADTTTFGANGFASAGYTDGGASTFRVGDLVRLVEIDSTSPTASTRHSVTAVSGSTITLSPSPSATFVSLAGTALKVLVIFDDWTTIEAGANATTQSVFAFLADASGALDATHGARIFAA